MIYTFEQIIEIAIPIAQKYNLKALWVFGSYVRGDAIEDSDIDLLMDDTDSLASEIDGLFDINDEFEQKFNKSVHLLTLSSLNTQSKNRYFYKVFDNINQTKILIYEKPDNQSL
jgi:predicted nucleotidyltransferase